MLSVSLASGVALLLAGHGILQPLFRAPRFLVSEVEVRWPEKFKLPLQRYRLLPATSIFQVDLEAVSQVLKRRYPAAEVEAVRRVLPNRLVATLVPKQVVAQIRAPGGDRYYPISEEGTVMAPAQSAPFSDLPILFLEGSRGPFQVGESLKDPDFVPASELLAAIRRQGGIVGHGASSIRVKNRTLSLFLDSGLEIRFAKDQLLVGWQRLGTLLNQRPDVLKRARYIDLRFDDPIIA